MPIAELEILGSLFTTISTAGVTGTDPATGSSRAVTFYNMPVPDAAYPYVRITITDTTNIETEPMNFGFVPTVKSIMVMVDSFSDYEPESFSIGSQLQTLVQHLQLNTTNFNGNTWLKSVTYFDDNMTTPDRVERRATLRVECRVQPN